MTRTPNLYGGLFLFILIYSALWFWFAGRFLPLNPDEIGRATYAYNFVTGQGLRGGINDDIFAPDAYKFRDCSFEVMRPVANGWLGLFLLVHRSPLWARLSSGVASLAALALFFLIGTRLHSPGLGLISVLVAVADPFWLPGSALVGPGMPLVAAAAVVLFLFMICKGSWMEFWIGVIAGLQVGIHPNAIPVHMGILTFYLFYRTPKSPGASIGRFSLGALVGVLLVISTLNIERVLIAQQDFLAPLTYPPIQSWPWRPVVWLKNTIHNLGSGESYYVSDNLVPAWSWSVKVYWVGVLMCLGYGAWLYGQRLEMRRSVMALGAALGTTFLGMVLLVARQEGLYALGFKAVIVPFVSLILYLAFTRQDKFSRVERLLVPGVFLASLCIFLSSAIRTPQRYKHYQQLIEESQMLLQPVSHSHVIGPMILWYALPPSAYRNVGALVISRYFNGGHVDLPHWVAHWPPDVFVVDWSFRRVYLKNPRIPEAENLQQLLHLNVHYIGEIDGGSFYNSYTFYQVSPLNT